MSVQLDMFNTVTPVATFDWADKTNLQIFDYTDDLKFDDVILKNNYVINVPVYRIEDVIDILYPDVAKRKGKMDMYWDIVKNKKFNHCVVRISDRDRYTCGDKFFVLATANFTKYLKQKALFAMLKNDIKKMPKLYKKVVQVAGVDYRKEWKSNFVQVYTLPKWSKEHVLSKV